MNKNEMESKMQTPPAMEAFEQRLLLAGDVLAEITSGGDLIITGDDAANNIVITEAAGVISISSADTTVNGEDASGVGGLALEGDFSKGMKIKMGDGADAVIIQGDLGDDDEIGGEDENADGDALAIAGNVQIDLGEGTEGVEQEAELLNVDVEGSVKITAKDDNDADVEINTATIGKNVQIALGGGDNDALVADTTIGGNLKIQNKDGEHAVTLDDADVTGSVSISNGSGQAVVQVRNDSDITKNLTIKNKDAAEGKTHDIDVTGDSDVAGSVKISNGKGDTDVNINGSDVGKNLSISSKGDEGDTNTVTVNNVDLGTADKRGSVKITAGKGASRTTVTDLQAGSLSVKGKGTAIITVDGGTAIVKKTMLTGGKAATSVHINDVIATGGLQIKGGGKETGALTVDIDLLTGGEKSKVTIAGGGDDDVITIDDIDVASLQLKTGKGDDFVHIEQFATDADIASTLGTLKVDTGDGDDTVTIGVEVADPNNALQSLTITGKGKLDGGKGTDRLDAALARGNVYDEDLLTLKNFEIGDSIV